MSTFEISSPEPSQINLLALGRGLRRLVREVEGDNDLESAKRVMMKQMQLLER